MHAKNILYRKVVLTASQAGGEAPVCVIATREKNFYSVIILTADGGAAVVRAVSLSRRDKAIELAVEYGRMNPDTLYEMAEEGMDLYPMDRASL